MPIIYQKIMKNVKKCQYLTCLYIFIFDIVWCFLWLLWTILLHNLQNFINKYLVESFVYYNKINVTDEQFNGLYNRLSIKYDQFIQDINKSNNDWCRIN